MKINRQSLQATETTLPAISVVGSFTLAMNRLTGLVEISQNGNAYEPIALGAAAVEWAEGADANDVILTTLTDRVVIGFDRQGVVQASLFINSLNGDIASILSKRDPLNAAFQAHFVAYDENDSLEFVLQYGADLELGPLITAWNLVSDAAAGVNIIKFRNLDLGTRSVAFFDGAGTQVTARKGQITDNTGGVVGNAIAAIAGSGADAALNNAIATILDRLNDCEKKLFELGVTV